MTDSWQQTNQISMSVRSAELRMPGLGGGSLLALSCQLVSIARGNCLLEIFPKSNNGGKSDNGGNADNVLEILVDRPLMTASLGVTQDLFKNLNENIDRSGSRPINITLTLAEELAVSIAGDLRIDEKTSVTITDASFIFPLR
jgi:hypothetical protein